MKKLFDSRYIPEWASYNLNDHRVCASNLERRVIKLTAAFVKRLSGAGMIFADGRERKKKQKNERPGGLLFKILR
jgi:hypothetical protein